MSSPPKPQLTSDHKALAARYYAQQILTQLSGRRVVFKADVDRVDFMVRTGATGIAQDPFMHEGRLVAAVLLDEPPAEARPFGDEVHWMEDVNLFDFEDEIELND